jgi:hypothetical protein
MDESITICIVAGPYVATHEEEYCPVCQEPLRPERTSASPCCVLLSSPWGIVSRW